MRGTLLLSLPALVAIAGCNSSQAQPMPALKRAATVQNAPMARIESLESPIKLEVQFNPKELTIDKPVPWQKHKNVEGDEPTLEFTGAAPKTLSVELLFDLFEEAGDVHKRFVTPLEQLASVDKSLKRPPLCTFTWGNNFPVFKGVVEDLNVKYTLFLPDGTPCRATVNLKMKQASSLMNKGEAEAANGCHSDADCKNGEVCRHGDCVTH